MKGLVLMVFTLVLVSTTHAKMFSSQYCSFELPTGWECMLEGSEWVCQSTNKARQKEAIIILAAKIQGPQDSLVEYTKYLKQKKVFMLPGGKTQVSEPKYTKPHQVNNHNWVDSLHLASEVPGFYTRYMATVSTELGVAVTFSVGKDFYSAYQGIFDQVIASLKIFEQKRGNLIQMAGAKGSDPLAQGGIIDGTDVGMIGKQKGPSKGFGDSDLYLLLIVGAAVAGFIIMKKRKGAKGKGKNKAKK